MIIMLTKIFTGTAYRFRHERAYLPSGYTGMCGESCDRNIGARGAFIAEDASHEHECIAWKESCLSYVKDSAEFAYVRNDDYGKEHCNSDFTGFRAKLLPDLPEGIREVITAVTVHPDSSKAKCRNEEISHCWSLLTSKGKTVKGGDWNTEKDEELQRP